MGGQSDTLLLMEVVGTPGFILGVFAGMILLTLDRTLLAWLAHVWALRSYRTRYRRLRRDR